MRFRSTNRPGTRRLRRGALALVIGAATGLSGMGIAQAGPASSAKPLTPTDAGQLITLITGDRVLLRDDGANSVLPARGSTGTIDSYQTGNGDRYFVPTAAMPYLGGELDRSLFDANALTAADTNGLLPVKLSFAAGSTPTAPAGITLTSVSGTTATGYLTAASGPAFADTLRSTVARDRTAGKPAGSTPLVPGLTSISLAGASTAPVATPHYPLHILQVDATDLTGRPAQFASLYLVDADNERTFLTVASLDGGIAKVAVPAGHYTAIVGFSDIDATGNLTASRTVLQDVTVADTGNTTVTVGESAATALIGVTTPKPTTTANLVVNYTLVDSAGDAASYSQLNFGTPPPTYVSPTSAPTTGKLSYQVEWLGSPTDPSQNYRYDVGFGSDNGIPAQEHQTVTADQVSTVHVKLSADPATKGETSSLEVGAIDPTYGGWSIGNSITTPADITDYVAGPAGDGWAQTDFTASSLVFTADQRNFVPGHSYDAEFGHGPIAAHLGQHSGQQFCLACVAGGTAVVGFNAIGDSDPSHAGQLFTNPTSSHFTLYRDGTVVFDQDGYDAAELDNQPTTAATYRAVFDLSLAGVAGVSQSTVTHTDVTVPYDPAATKGNTLPAESGCAGGVPGTPCLVLPMLDLDYQLATDANNTSTSPVQVLNLRVGHVNYDGAGSHAAIRSASVQVSFDNGATWKSVPTLGFAGNYVALWANPKAGVNPSIKVTATDANGGSITQTVTNAYTVGTSSH